MTDFAAPFRSSPMTVKPEWIDYNGHLNMAYYNVLMDLGCDQAYALLGFGPDYAARHRHTTFSAEYRMRYVREIHSGAQVFVTLQMLDNTNKSFHFVQSIYHEDGWLSAEGEGIGLHIDMDGPRVAALPADILARLQAMVAAHSVLPRPDWISRPLGLRR